MDSHPLSARVALDHVRTHPEYLGRAPAARASGAWVALGPLVDVAAEVVDRDSLADQVLSAEQLRVLQAWLEGATPEEISRSDGSMGPRDAERILRAALKRLRDRYREPLEKGIDHDSVS